MSRENVELVRRAYGEGWMDGDPTPCWPWRFHTWTFAEGKIVSFEWGRDLGQALKAVGLAE